MTSETHQLEHFYYGQFVRDGAPEGDLRVLATSAGLKSEQAADIAKGMLLPPQRGVPMGAWALVRGKKVPFVLVQSQLGEAGQSMLHYLLMPSDLLRALGGNVDALIGLLEAQMPTYDRLGDTLPPLEMQQVGPPEGAEQIDHILDLMTFTQNRLNVVETLLSAIVQGVQLVVQDAPLDLESRAGLVKGLLALLPPPARFGVTFATHTVGSTRIDAQIRFYSDDQPPPETLVYHWPDTEASGKIVEDDYSHFIISQLRLDAELVSRQTRALTSVAAWRIKRGDRLADALAYASYRLALDNSIQNNLPVEADEVSKVLAEDPTLDDRQRVMYARHLLNLSLAVGDMRYADPVSLLLRQHDDLNRETRRLLAEALEHGQAEAVYAALSRWLANPLGPHGEEWSHLAQDAAVDHMMRLVHSGDILAVNHFLETVHQAHPGIEIGAAVPRLVEIALPLSVQHQQLAETTFLLAINYMDTEVVERLLKSRRFSTQLPPTVNRLAPYLTNSDEGLAPSGLLSEAALAFGENWQPLVLTRFTEAALLNERRDLIDTSVVAGLVRVALSEWSVQYDRVLRWIVENMSEDEVLTRLEDPGPRYLLQVLLALGAYYDLANEMLHQSRLLFPGDLQAKYALMVQSLFAETPIPTEEVPHALHAIHKEGIKSLPLVMAYIGALDGHEWVEVLDEVAAEVTEIIFDNRNVLAVIHPNALLALLRFHTKRQDVAKTAQVASLFPEAAITRGNSGIGLMTRMYNALDWDKELKIAAMELLRRYIRMLETGSARRAIVQFGRALGDDVQDALEATLALKRLMGGVDFIDYADFLHVVAELLQDTTLAYVDRSNVPTLGGLVNAMQSMSGSLGMEDRETVTKDVLAMARAAVALGKQYQDTVPRDQDKYIERLLTRRANPRSGIDVLRVMGGYFAKGKRYNTRFDRPTKHPLAERSAPMMRDEFQITNHLLRSVMQSFPVDKEVTMSTEAILGEVESLWGNLTLEQQREIVRGLAIDLQRIADLIPYITEQGDARALENSSLGRRLDAGKYQPRSTLEFYRYMYGYFRSLSNS
ncbi:MAG: hypothetical protein K8L99_25615 [Anaerolineae bacterium]|nr:hypothetical protein [Anaerolineae bacterium]